MGMFKIQEAKKCFNTSDKLMVHISFRRRVNSSNGKYCGWTKASREAAWYLNLFLYFLTHSHLFAFRLIVCPFIRPDKKIMKENRNQFSSSFAIRACCMRMFICNLMQKWPNYNRELIWFANEAVRLDCDCLLVFT